MLAVHGDGRMASDDKPTHDEVLDFTPEQWERHRWLAEKEAHERELTLKEREDRRSFFTNPLLLSIVGAIIAFMVNAANDAWTKSRNLAQSARESEAAMIQKAMDQDDPAKVIARLRLLDAAGMIPRHRDQLRVLWTDEKAAQLFVSASSGKPADGAAAADAGPPQPCDKATATGQGGWLYLGRATRTAWVPGERGSDLIKWEQPPEEGRGFLDKAKGKCLHVVQPKFLRDDGPAGEKRHMPIKMPVTPQMRMRVTELDEGDPNRQEPHQPIWGRVEVLAN
jgi:hypothetical protein